MPSPADVDLLVEFLNTLDEPAGTDELADQSACVAWFRARGLATAGLTVGDVQAVRAALRVAADVTTAPADESPRGRRSRVGDALARVPLHLDVTDGVPHLGSKHPLGPVVATAAALSYEGQWDRLKLCDMHSCRYAFFDRSRNRSGRWCDMRVCGNRAKTRAFRERHGTG